MHGGLVEAHSKRREDGLGSVEVSAVFRCDLQHVRALGSECSSSITENGLGFFSGAEVSLDQLAVWTVKSGPEEFVLLAGDGFSNS